MNITIADFETGGLKSTENPITEVGLLNINLETFKVNWEYQTYVKPYGGLKINPIVYEKTMVKPTDVENGIDSKTLVREMIRLFKSANTSNGHERGNTILCGHKFVAFDRLFLEVLFESEGKDVYEFVSREIIDTLTMSRIKWMGDTKPFKLSECCKRIGYNLVGAHGAMADVRATFELMKYFVKTNSVESTVVTNKQQINNHRKFFNF